MDQLLLAALIAAAAQPSTHNYPDKSYDDSEGFSFVDCVRSIDCDRADKSAWCVHSTDATVVTKQALQLPLSGSSTSVAFRVRIESMGDASKAMCVGFMPAGTQKRCLCFSLTQKPLLC